MANLGKEVQTQLGAEVVKSLLRTGFQGVLGMFTEGAGEKLKDATSHYFFGNKEADEQVFKRAAAYALEHELITPQEHDEYIKAVKALPRERQNDYRLHVIQTWMKDATGLKPEDIIAHSAEVLAYDAKLVTRGVWDDNKVFYDLDQSILPTSFNIDERINRLRSRNRELDEKSKRFWFAVAHPIQAWKRQQARGSSACLPKPSSRRVHPRRCV